MPFDKKIAVHHIMHDPKRAAYTFIGSVTTGGVDVGDVISWIYEVRLRDAKHTRNIYNEIKEMITEHEKKSKRLVRVVGFDDRLAKKYPRNKSQVRFGELSLHEMFNALIREYPNIKSDKYIGEMVDPVDEEGVGVVSVSPRKRKLPESCVSGVKMTGAGAGRTVTGREE